MRVLLVSEKMPHTEHYVSIYSYVGTVKHRERERERGFNCRKFSTNEVLAGEKFIFESAVAKS